ncbi:membrane protein [Clostridia bacterium]|nr:membrane protein [Clostridia bacterium]
MIKKNLPTVAVLMTIAVFFAVLIIVISQKDITYTMYNVETISYEKGVVRAILAERTEPANGMTGWSLGIQEISVEITNGIYKGQLIKIDNMLSTDHNVRVKAGQAVIIKADRPQGIDPYYTIYNYDRAQGVIIIAALFALLMAVVGKAKGVRSVLGLGVSLALILGFMLPAIYKGYSPVLTAAVTVAGVAAFSLILLNGLNRKTVVSLGAVIICAGLAAACYGLITSILNLTGYNVDGMEELIMISRNTGLKLGQVLFVSVLISSLGAIMDVSISISSSMFEITRVNSGISAKKLLASGIEVGRDLMGANCQTLILAFVGSSLATLLVLISYGTMFDQFLSSDYMAVEILHGIAGSMAVIAAVPITAAMCAFLSEKGSPPVIRQKVSSNVKNR